MTETALTALALASLVMGAVGLYLWRRERKW